MKRKKKRKAITAREMEEAYRRCLERERDRERKRRKTSQGAFESSILHLDFEEEESRERERSTSWLSDRGRGAQQIRGVDGPTPDQLESARQKRINRARMAVARHLPGCLTTFWLVLRNGNNRKESIWQIMKNRKSNNRPNGTPQRHSTLHSSKKS